MKKVFQVQIYNDLYWVWNIEGKQHPYDNGAAVKTWWVYYDPHEKAEFPEGVTPPVDSPHLHPFTDDHWFPRHNWEIKIKQQTTTKLKWDELRFNSGTVVEMFCNGNKFFSFSTCGDERGLNYAWHKAMYMMVQLLEHPFNFFNPASENGRKIWFYGLPATVITSEHVGWEIGIKPDYQEFMETQGIASLELAKDKWINEYKNRRTKLGERPDTTSNFQEVDKMYEDQFTEDLYKGHLNHGSAFSDGNINWFRR